MRTILALVLLLLAGCERQVPQNTTELEAGRFVIVQSREQEGDYLLDTATGKVWASNRLKDHGGRLIWLYSTRLDNREQTISYLKSLGVDTDAATPLP